jgi:hypothetical protein
MFSPMNKAKTIIQAVSWFRTMNLYEGGCEIESTMITYET